MLKQVRHDILSIFRLFTRPSRIDLARGIQLETDANYSNDNVSGANLLTLTAVGNHSQATVAGTVMASEGTNKDEDLYGLGTIDAGNTVEPNQDVVREGFPDNISM